MKLVPLTHPIPRVVSDCSRSVLEWDRFLDLLASYAQSATGKQWLTALAPSTDVEWVRGEHTLVAEMRLLLHAGARPSLSSLFDPSEVLAKSRIEGAALEAEGLHQDHGPPAREPAWQDQEDSLWPRSHPLRRTASHRASARFWKAP